MGSAPCPYIARGCVCGRHRRRDDHHRPANKANRSGTRNSLRPRIDQAGSTLFLWTPEMNMKLRDLKLMSTDELWALHLEITNVLASRI